MKKLYPFLFVFCLSVNAKLTTMTAGEFYKIKTHLTEISSSTKIGKLKDKNQIFIAETIPNSLLSSEKKKYYLIDNNEDIKKLLEAVGRNLLITINLYYLDNE